MFTPAAAIDLDERQRHELEKLVRAGTTTQRLARRCQVILLAAQGEPNQAIARQVGVSRPTVLALRTRFRAGGVEALRHDQPRQRSRRRVTPELEQRVLDLTLHSRPADATPWSTRRLARELGMARRGVQADLGAPCLAAAPGGKIQALQRPAF